MNFELYIENLGAIEKAEMTINPLTILAGENGTGKSFVTKFLYSVLNVLMKDVYKNELIDIINVLEINNNELKDLSIQRKVFKQEIFHNFYIFLMRLKDKVSKTNNISKESFHEEVQNIPYLIKEYFTALEKINESANSQEIDDFSKISIWAKMSYPLNTLILYHVITNNHISSINKLYELINTPQISSFETLEIYLTSEIKSNFQISNLKQLIKKDKDNLIFEIKGIIKIEIQENELKITQHDITRTDIKNINRLVFFESPIYWRLSRDLIENSHQPKTYYLSNEINDERLTGIPKHFLDLRELVFANFKHGERPKFIEQCADDLQKHLNGKFNTDSYDLSFETNQGQPIVKNLVSFGMTNLGIIQAVLSKNIINKGSFVFIDEPESNLHPEWQAVLADILVKLAENGVFVVITTHSSDMLKALDVISQEHKQDEDFTSVNYFEKGGILAELNQENISTVQQARLKLLETYDDLVLRGYLV